MVAESTTSDPTGRFTRFVERGYRDPQFVRSPVPTHYLGPDLVMICEVMITAHFYFPKTKVNNMRVKIRTNS